jgi:glycine hydroxymethyltransferase
MSIIFDLIEEEKERQATTIELIASENFVSDNVLKALGSCLTNKYSEGYPDCERSGNRGRYYGGCENVDLIEQECCDLWRQVFATNYHVNVQPHSGSQANYAAYAAILKPGDTILAMSLDNGGHLTHGSSVNFSGKLYNMVFYNVDEAGYIDYNDLYNKLIEFKPKLVVAGASAYPREIDFKRIYEIIEWASYSERWDNPPFFMVDMAHIAGLVAVGAHQSPFNYADIITTTTHKTLRGPRGGMIFCKPYLAKKVDSAVFPGSQGGPLQNVVAAKAIAAEECLTPEYGTYIRNVVRNCRIMADVFKTRGFKVVTDGTDNHLFLVDLSETHPNVSGRDVQERLDEVGITLNKNCVPGEKRSPKEASGIRIGTAAMTTKGFTADNFIIIANRICDEIDNLATEKTLCQLV